MSSYQVFSTQQPSPRPDAAGHATRSILAMIAAMGISTAAHAEYRCSTPGSLTVWENRACELARQDAPSALIHFIHRLNIINAGLYIDDYVGKADAERWDVARRSEEARSITAVDNRDKGRSVSR